MVIRYLPLLLLLGAAIAGCSTAAPTKAPLQAASQPASAASACSTRFAALDANHDGAVSPAEFSAGNAKRAYGLAFVTADGQTAAPAPGDAVTPKLVARAPQGTGPIMTATADEAATPVVARAPQGTGPIMTATTAAPTATADPDFSRLDVNADGQLSPAELCAD